MRINFDFPVEQTQKKGLFQDNKYRRWFKFSIDDGRQPNDTYLSNYDMVEKYTYETYYDGQEHREEFKINTLYEFRESVEWRHQHPDLNSFPRTINIKITQHLKNGTIYDIRYNNIALKY